MKVLTDPTGVKIAGIFEPTEVFTQRIAAAAKKVQECIKIEDSARVSTFERKDLPTCTEEWDKVMEEYKAFYHPKIFPQDDSPDNQTLFDWSMINQKWPTKILAAREGLYKLDKFIVTVIIPLYREGIVSFAVKRREGKAVEVEWKPGCVIMVPGRADLRILGAGQLGHFHIAWGRADDQKVSDDIGKLFGYIQV